jgi:hypothetical protein
MGAKALLDILLIRFDYIARLSQWGGVGYFTRSNDFYLPSRRLEDMGGIVSSLWGTVERGKSCFLSVFLLCGKIFIIIQPGAGALPVGSVS